MKQLAARSPSHAHITSGQGCKNALASMHGHEKFHKESQTSAG